MLVWVGLIGKKTLSASVSADVIFFLCRVMMKILQKKNLAFCIRGKPCTLSAGIVENNATIVYGLHIKAVMFV